jgi:CheY-like chemotaxis protein
MALRDAPPGSRLRRDVESMMIAGERGRALVDRILAFSRSGVAERVAVPVEEVVRETLALLTAKLPAGVVVEESLRTARAAVMGDATQIHQVLMNLVTNSVQAMPSGGTLRVSLEAAHIDAPRVATTGTVEAGDYLVLEVADTGTGIPVGILEKIFDPFFTTKEVGVGTGLGLSLVHGIVTGLGGAIDVATALGEGTVFTVYLPRTADVADVPKSGEGDEATMRRGGQEQVLVVDDEASLLRLATETLSELGYAPVAFRASAAALAVFLADPDRFDAVITDESMPGLTGSELIRKIRAVRPQIPVVLMTGLANAAVIQRAKDAGATEVLRKPLSARQLATAVERVLHEARPPVTGNPAARSTPRAAQPQRRGSGSSRTRRARR